VAETARQPGHLDALDGLRGIACLVVFLHHCTAAFWFSLYTRPDLNPLTLLCNGTFAVHVFFVMSGFVLSLAYVRTPRLPILVSATARRYFRLAIPSTVAVLIAYALMALGFGYAQDLARIVEHSAWIEKQWTFPPLLGSALKQGLWNSCFGGTQNFDGVLWTMQYEFKGSLILFGALALTTGIKNRGFAFLAAAAGFLVFGGWEFAEFLLGGLLCIVWVQRGASIANRYVALLVLAASLYIAWRLPTHMADWSWGDSKLREWVSGMLGAIGVVSVAAYSPLVQRTLSSRPFVWLGKISFPLYLIHMPILLSAGAGVYCALHGRGWAHDWAGLAAFATTAALSFPAAALGTATIEPWSVRIGQMAYRVLFEPVAEPAMRKTVGEDSVSRESRTVAA
jgi:peptidoglycan/LPS O-acetylase OafA/YrhL